jgi:cytosine/adenosine deaminase-related metal-dependent hydrolase
VHLNASDVEILKKRGVRVVLCPRSNDKLDVGKAPAYLLKKAGIPLALGTDSLASNDSLSMQDEMIFAMGSYQGVFTPEEILRMATLGGAEALRIDHETGSLEEGKRADFLIMGVEKVSSLEDLPRAILEEGKIQEVAAGGAFLTFPPPCT